MTTVSRAVFLGGVPAVLLLVVGFAQAMEAPGTESTTVQDTQLIQSPLTEHERTRAALWELSHEEWQRYRLLMAGIRGALSSEQISPIEVLGIHARDDAERQQYAERWAVMMREDAERVLAFQHAYDEAGRRLYPDETLIDVARLADRTRDTDRLQAGDRLLLFVRPDCSACDALLARVLARLDRVAGLDIYLTDIATGNEVAIRSWASGLGIQPEWVKTRRVTLNFDHGALTRIAPEHGDLPILIRRRGTSLTQVSGSVL